MNESYYYLNEARQKTGPVSYEELIKRLREHYILPDTLVWCEGMPEWLSIRYVIMNQGLPVDRFATKRAPIPENHLIQAVLVTLFCCWPCGIVAIIRSAQVETYYYQGRYEDAIQASASSLRWGQAGLLLVLIPLAVAALVLLFMCLAGVKI